MLAGFQNQLFWLCTQPKKTKIMPYKNPPTPALARMQTRLSCLCREPKKCRLMDYETPRTTLLVGSQIWFFFGSDQSKKKKKKSNLLLSRTPPKPKKLKRKSPFFGSQQRQKKFINMPTNIGCNGRLGSSTTLVVGGHPDEFFLTLKGIIIKW